MMGPLSVLKIWDSRLGVLSSQDKNVYLYRKTEEDFDFIQQYSFIILGSLQKYFPMVNKLHLKKRSLWNRAYMWSSKAP